MATNPFIARSGTDPKVFVGRDEELAFFKEDRLKNLLEGRCLHYAITGSWGVGKTILLRQIKAVAQQEGVWAPQFSLRKFRPSETSSDFAQHILGNTAAELPFKKMPSKRKLTGAGASVFGFGFQFSFSDPALSAAKDPQVLLRDGLLEIYEHAISNRAKALILLLDDIQNLSDGVVDLTLFRNVLTDPRIAGKLKLLVIVSSTSAGWEPFLEKDHPIGRLFMPRREIGRLSEAEVHTLIRKSLSGTGISFDKPLQDAVFETTKGHVFEVQALCEALFDMQIGGRVTMDAWEPALQHTLLALADAQFTSMLRLASEQEQTVLAILAESRVELGPADIKAKLPGVGNPAMILRRLVDKGLAENPKRGAFILPDRLFAEFVLTKVEQK